MQRFSYTKRNEKWVPKYHLDKHEDEADIKVLILYKNLCVREDMIYKFLKMNIPEKMMD